MIIFLRMNKTNPYDKFLYKLKKVVAKYLDIWIIIPWLGDKFYNFLSILI